MLVLTRKTNQQIQIGENIVITILHVRGQSVRVGIEAPRQVRVVRSEIADLAVEAATPESGSPQPSSTDDAETSDLPATRAWRVTSPAKAHASYAPALRRADAGCFSSPLGDRVMAVLESSGGEASAANTFPVEPPAGRQDGPHDYHMPSGRCSVLTTRLSGQRP